MSETLPHYLSGWAQGRLFPPSTVEFHATLTRWADEREPWHLGLALTDEAGTAIAIESLWLPRNLAREQVLSTKLLLWREAQGATFEPI